MLINSVVIFLKLQTLENGYFSENLKFLLKEFEFVMSQKNWRNMVHTASSASEPMTSYICYHGK